MNFSDVILLCSLLTAQSSASPIALPQESSAASNLTLLEQVNQQFKVLDIHFTGGQYHDQKFSYRLYVPSRLAPNVKYPLLLWLHGLGEQGTDNRRHLSHIDTAIEGYIQEHGQFPAFVLAYQIPKGANWYNDNVFHEGDFLSLMWGMVQRTIQEYPIDPDRISMSGVSSGGTACWEMGMRHPGQFAAIAPISSWGGDDSRAAELSGVPIWTFINSLDLPDVVMSTRQSAEAVRAAGGRVKLTEMPNVGHDAWDQAFRNYHLLEWLLARRRAERNPNLYFQFVGWQRIAVECGLPVAALTACVIWICHKFLAGKGAHRNSMDDDLGNCRT